MDIHTFGYIIHVTGELMIAYSVLIVHHRVSVERKIDIHVTRAMGHERIAVFTGIIFIISGALLEKL